MDNQPSRSAALRAAEQNRGVHHDITVLLADPDVAADPVHRRRLANGLAAVDGELVMCADGAHALLQVGRLAPDLVMLAVRLPVVAAADVVRVVRTVSNVPILLGIGSGETECAGPAFLAGASTAVRRPVELRELLAHVREHRARLEAPSPARAVLTYGPLELDALAYTVRRDGDELELPLKEFELLRVLMLQADRVVSTEHLRSAVWGTGAEAPTSNTVAVHMSRLRARLGGPDVLRTVRRLGYRLTYTTYGIPAHGRPRPRPPGAVEGTSGRPIEGTDLVTGRPRSDPA